MTRLFILCHDLGTLGIGLFNCCLCVFPQVRSYLSQILLASKQLAFSHPAGSPLLVSMPELRNPVYTKPHFMQRQSLLATTTLPFYPCPKIQLRSSMADSYSKWAPATLQTETNLLITAKVTQLWRALGPDSFL